jgi:hypothetical protein
MSILSGALALFMFVSLAYSIMPSTEEEATNASDFVDKGMEEKPLTLHYLIKIISGLGQNNLFTVVVLFFFY